MKDEPEEKGLHAFSQRLRDTAHNTPSSQSLVKFGYEVTVLCRNTGGKKSSEVLEGVRIKRIKPESKNPLIRKFEFTYLLIKAALSESASVYHCHRLVTLPHAYIELSVILEYGFPRNQAF